RGIKDQAKTASDNEEGDSDEEEDGKDNKKGDSKDNKEDGPFVYIDYYSKNENANIIQDWN
ncbi:15140_t:CDS:2, partial [Cetraspora pellucida]